LARWNNIGPDFHITGGQALILAPTGPATAMQRSPSSNAPVRPALIRPAPGPGVPGWAWPTDRSGAPRPVPGGGILVSGQVGQNIRAASAGRVVYSGSGIRGYGNLIIIKHGENLLSAYAHNRDSLVHDGQEVALGEVIGHMGEGAPSKPVLYFEIRRNGKPIDPLHYLPDVK
jgi:lipoprotein NlpD